MSRVQNMAVFKHTEHMYLTNEYLKKETNMSASNQFVIPETAFIRQIPSGTRDTQFIVSKKRTLEAAKEYAAKGKKVMVLNFASPLVPGGNVSMGTNTQEEALCRATNLYSCLNREDILNNFYIPHKNNSNLANDDCIYTPDITVFKTDDDDQTLLPQDQWYKVDVLSCAAPNLHQENVSPFASFKNKYVPVDEKKMLGIFEKRFERILQIAQLQEAEVVILGAFGCGAYENEPSVVARAAANASRKFKGSFDTIEFAVYCTDVNRINFVAFSNEFEPQIHFQAKSV